LGDKLAKAIVYSVFTTAVYVCHRLVKVCYCWVGFWVACASFKLFDKEIEANLLLIYIADNEDIRVTLTLDESQLWTVTNKLLFVQV